MFGQSETSEESAVAETVTELYAAMVDKDPKALDRLTSENLDYGHSSGTLEDKSEYIDAVLNGPFDFITINPEEQQIKVSDDMAIVRHFFVANGTQNGNPVDVRIGALLIFIKENTGWKLLARQAYRL